MPREWVTLAGLKALANETSDARDGYWLACAHHASTWLETALGRWADAGQLEEGSPYRDQAESVGTDKALAYHYSLQGWPDRERPKAEAAQQGLEALIDRLKADRPGSVRTVVTSRNLARGHVIFDGAGNATLAVG